MLKHIFPPNSILSRLPELYINNVIELVSVGLLTKKTVIDNMFGVKLVGVGPVDNRPSTDKASTLCPKKKKKNCDM